MTAGKDFIFDVVIEISADSQPVKYEFDKEHNMLRVDRIMATSMQYPCNYGFIPNTKGGDGDPIDVLVYSSYPIMPGTLIKVRPIGVLNTEDESGQDAKILSVPIDKIDQFMSNITKYTDLPQIFLDKIANFFENYKKLEKGKWVNVSHWEDNIAAQKIVAESMLDKQQ